MARKATLHLWMAVLLLAPRFVFAQRADDLTVGARAFPNHRNEAVARLPESAPDVAPTTVVGLDGLRMAPVGQAVAESHTHIWPWCALGGAIVGGASVLGFAVSHCDANCRDDGALGYVGPFVAVGAIVGALIGGVTGLIVDSTR